MAETPHLADENQTAEIRKSLLRWFAEEHRPLPWRVKPSPYKTVVSEFMLQQTQVATVIPFFEAFIKQFPSFKALARASEQDVLRAWSGLGYYRRARNLKRTAEEVTRSHGGRLPRDPAALRALPGFGKYTVGAVGSITLGLRLPLVDGNVRRVVGRLFALEGDLTKGEGGKRLWSLCEQLVDPARPGDFNQGLMELGAMVCLPREPLCLVCPIYSHCLARAAGYPEAYPRPPARPKTKQVREVAVAVTRGDRVLALQRGEGGSFAGMWELPRLDNREIEDHSELTPARVVFDLVRVRPGRATLVGESESTFTHHRIRTELYTAQARGAQRVRRQRHIAHQWVKRSALGDLPASKAQRRLFDLLQD